MTESHGEHLEKAGRLLRQARIFSVADAPESVVHLSYYAMFHAATAVLLKHRGKAALTHAGLIETFGQFVKNHGETARQHGRALNRAKDLRLLADYGIAYQDLVEASTKIREEACAFAEFCKSVVATRGLG